VRFTVTITFTTITPVTLSGSPQAVYTAIITHSVS
jgi:hypothetical protein